MLYLVVEVSSEPVSEPGGLYIAGPSKLHGDPISLMVCVDFHGQVIDLSDPGKPVALQEPDEEVPAKARPEATQ